MNELKKCPFCGGEVRFVKTGCSSRGKIGHLYCDGCKETFFKNDKWHTESELCEIWNNRKPIERVIERLEERIKILDNTSDINYPSVDIAINETKKIIEIIKEEMM